MTVCRAGILYINPGDLGWNPYVTSWIETRDFNMTRRQMLPEAQEEAESEESVRWLSYILDNDEAESGK